MLIPLEIKSKNKSSVHTIIFKNKWFDQSALFTTKTSESFDHVIKDQDGIFRDIIDIRDFLKILLSKNYGEKFKYKDGYYLKDKIFLKYIEAFL